MKTNTLKKLTRYPTVAEVAASYAPPIYESYWWATGWNFNRPLIAKFGVGAHIRDGAYVWIEVGDNCPIGGYKVADLEKWGISMTFWGPIVPPDFGAEGNADAARTHDAIKAAALAQAREQA